MIRTYLTSASLFAMALLLVPGCGKKNKDSNNPDGAGDGSSVDGTDGQGDSAGTPSHARGSTATRGGGRNTKARAKSMSAAKPPRKPVEEPASLNGMAVEAWKLESNVLPNFAELGATVALGSVDMVNVADQDASAGFPGMTDLTNNFVLRLSGTINITTEAEYELCINSDDGSQLLLENTVVVDNDGKKDEATEACGLVYLTPGEYQLAIHYFQADGARMALQFAWAQDGGDKALVPSEVLFKPAAR
ncbi:PA14 domain-containing protein [Nannocystaceae bacterium ST9]